MNLSVCIEMIFQEEHDFTRRIYKSAAVGLPNVEMWRWRDKNLDAIERALGETGGHLMCFVSEPGGRLVDPATHAAFLQGLRDSIPVARRFGTRSLIVLSGDTLDGVPREEQHAAVRDALIAAAPIVEDAGITLNLEPLNTRVDHIGYFLDSTAEGLQIVEEVASPGVKLLYDLYHSVVMNEDPREVLQGRIDLVGHVHLADHPGRHEPGSGDALLETYLAWLQQQGYEGFIGLEYLPTGDSTAALESTKVLASRASAVLPQH
ncbi:TIM barrel protein [Deinococcus apachensis]|uniref:TIM barrel protein n=1 Tax=Deinococcus apachensis TaxID=309886 RepID=UPI0003A32B8D|nr:TIM barrel protein [Deinococcus apachensis]